MSEIRELQLKLLEMIEYFDAFCKENKIDYVISYGNVLGAVRHGGFIPWDDDLDVELTRENYNKLLKCFKNNEKYSLQVGNVDYPLLFSKLRLNNSTFIEDIPYKKKYKNINQGLFIDIFPVDKVANKKNQIIKQKLFSNIVIAQSLFLRGYPKSHNNLKKRIIIFFSVLLLPLRKYFIKYVEKFNSNENFKYYCLFFGDTRNIFLNKDTYTAPFELLKFENLKLPVMHNYSGFLTDYYGDYMKLPSEEEISYSIHAKYFDINKSYKEYLNID